MRRTPGALALYALVTVFLVGATTAFVAFNKSVTVSVDGKTRHLTTFSHSVGAVLQAAGIEYDRRDLVVPPPDKSVGYGSRIVVTHARKLNLTVDGKNRTVRVTANTVQEALKQLEFNARGAALSASRSKRLPLSGFSLRVRLPRTVTLEIGDARLRIKTAAPTVRQLLARAGIDLGPHDAVDVKLGARPEDGQVIQITQVVGEPETRTLQIDYETVRRPSDALSEGETKVVQEGREGLKKVVVATVIEDGRKVEDVVAKHVVREPRKEIVEYGTQARTIESVADLNWEALAECESDGDPNAVNPAGPYYGLYQFSLSTWQSVGGEGLPTDAPASEQTYRAQKLYVRGGDEQWPVCGERLHDQATGDR